MIDLENLDDLYRFQEISKKNKNFQILFNRDLARKLKEIELTPKDFNDLKKSFIEDGKLGKDRNFYNLIKKKSRIPAIYFGLLFDCRYDGASLNLRWFDLENLYFANTNVRLNSNVIYYSSNVKKDEQAETLKALFMNYLEFVSKFIK